MNTGSGSRASALQLAWILVAAAFSAAYFHPDEMHQTLELAALKLGMLPVTDMPWEYSREMRPWAQPALYAGIVGTARAIGIANPFVHSALCRAVTGVFGWLAARALLRATLPHVPVHARRAHVFALTLLPCLPYLFVRTSSEMLAAACLAGALAGLGPALAFPSASSQPAGITSKSALTVGAFLGGAFVMRYQSAFFCAGLLLWCTRVSTTRAKTFAAITGAALLVVAIGTAFDAWGYGHFTVTPWNYVRVNLIEGVAKSFGTDPFFAYAYLLPSNLLAPVVILLMVTSLIFCLRFPGHALTWAVVPHFVMHSLIAHKEERFMFPLVTACAAMIVPALVAPSAGRSRVARSARRAATWLWDRRSSAAARVFGAYSMFVGVAISVYPINAHAQTRMMMELYARSPARSWVMYSMNVEHAPLYRAAGATWKLLPVLDEAHVRSGCAHDPRPVFIITKMGESVPFAKPLFTDGPFGSAEIARKLFALSTHIRERWLASFPTPMYMTVHQANDRVCFSEPNLPR